jgi:hypothetical protein
MFFKQACNWLHGWKAHNQACCGRQLPDDWYCSLHLPTAARIQIQWLSSHQSQQLDGSRTLSKHSLHATTFTPLQLSLLVRTLMQPPQAGVAAMDM